MSQLVILSWHCDHLRNEVAAAASIKVDDFIALISQHVRVLGHRESGCTPVEKHHAEDIVDEQCA